MTDQDIAGYYVHGPNKVYCGMNYTGSSCWNIYNNNPETDDKSGYYRINDNQWTYCNMTELLLAISPHVLVWEEDGDELPISISCQETIAPVDGIELLTLMLVSVIRVIAQLLMLVPLPSSPLMEQVIRRCVVEQEDIRRDTQLLSGDTMNAPKQLMVLMLIPYKSTIIAHINTFGPLLVDSTIIIVQTIITFVHVMSVEDLPLLVGHYYCCESQTIDENSFEVYFLSNTLWDGSGCLPGTCCDDTTQPWFYRELSETTTSDIEARLCSFCGFTYRAVLIDQLELYIQ